MWYLSTPGPPIAAPTPSATSPLGSPSNLRAASTVTTKDGEFCSMSFSTASPGFPTYRLDPWHGLAGDFSRRGPSRTLSCPVRSLEAGHPQPSCSRLGALFRPLSDYPWQRRLLLSCRPLPLPLSEAWPSGVGIVRGFRPAS